MCFERDPKTHIKIDPKAQVNCEPDNLPIGLPLTTAMLDGTKTKTSCGTSTKILYDTRTGFLIVLESGNSKMPEPETLIAASPGLLMQTVHRVRIKTVLELLVKHSASCSGDTSAKFSDGNGTRCPEI